MSATFPSMNPELAFRLKIQNSTKGIGAPVNSMLNVETEPMILCGI